MVKAARSLVLSLAAWGASALQDVPEKLLEVREPTSALTEGVQLTGQDSTSEDVLEAIKAQLAEQGVNFTAEVNLEEAEKPKYPVMHKGNPVLIKLGGHEYPAVAETASKDGKMVDVQFWYGPVKPKVMGIPSRFVTKAPNGRQAFADMKKIGENPENAEKIVRLAQGLAKVGAMSAEEKKSFQMSHTRSEVNKDVLPMPAVRAATQASKKAAAKVAKKHVVAPAAKTAPAAKKQPPAHTA